MITFCVFNQKGGVGKTSCAMLIADGLQKKGARVLLVDTDPQKSAHMWEARTVEGYSPYPVRVEAVSGLSIAEFSKWLTKRISDIDYLIIDTPPNLVSLELEAALYICDVAVLPIQPHVACIDALEKVIPLVKSIEKKRGAPLDIRVLLNHYVGRRSSEKYLLSSIKTISPWPILTATLKDLAGFSDAYTYRTSLYTLSGTSDARKALDTLVAELTT
ncbi:MAG: ParA family protein [Agitococcus sp.]|nr:ParA family protein [Agitococcus sp.]MDO9177006.1 ParA family protein [Agitococcus sp.]